MLFWSEHLILLTVGFFSYFSFAKDYVLSRQNDKSKFKKNKRQSQVVVHTTTVALEAAEETVTSSKPA